MNLLFETKQEYLPLWTVWKDFSVVSSTFALPWLCYLLGLPCFLVIPKILQQIRCVFHAKSDAFWPVLVSWGKQGCGELALPVALWTRRVGTLRPHTCRAVLTWPWPWWLFTLPWLVPVVLVAHSGFISCFPFLVQCW